MATGGDSSVGEGPSEPSEEPKRLPFMPSHEHTYPLTLQYEETTRKDNEEVRSKRGDRRMKDFHTNVKHTRLMATLSTTDSDHTSLNQPSRREPKQEEVRIPNLDLGTPVDRYGPPELLQGKQTSARAEPESNEAQRPANVTKPLAIVVCEHKIMDEDISYHQAITGKEAERRLEICGSHCYLTRYSEANKCYLLTVYKKKPTYVMKHFKILFEHNEGGRKIYKIEGMEREFGGLRAMLGHYERNRIDPALENIGRRVSEDDYTSKWCTIL